MSALGRFLLRAVTGVGLSAVTLVIEILLAFGIYMYLAINHVETFGAMVRYASGVLRWAAETLEASFPQFADQAYATLLGELGPKSALLLFIGLFASGAIRLLRWILLGMMRRVGVGQGGGL